MEKLPNCYKCKKKESACFQSNNIKIKLDNGKEFFPLICGECKMKEEKH